MRYFRGNFAKKDFHHNAQKCGIILAMSRSVRDKIEFMLLCVSKFAKAGNLSTQGACEYLHNFKGLEFLDTHYAVESTYSSRIVMEDLASVCQQNGGAIRW